LKILEYVNQNCHTCLNPHAGDNGLIGDEEQREIIPAIESACDEGILAFGPFPADGFFGTYNLNKFDGILAMYHDQGMIPFKSLSMEEELIIQPVYL